MDMDAHSDILNRLSALEKQVEALRAVEVLLPARPEIRDFYRKQLTPTDTHVGHLNERIAQLEAISRDQLTEIGQINDEQDRLREENQTLRTGAVEQARTIEQLKAHVQEKTADAMKFAGEIGQLKQRVKDYEGDNHRLVDENHKFKQENQRLRNDLELKIAENDGLRQAPEVLKTELGSLIQEISKQRDHWIKEYRKVANQFNALLEALGEVRRETSIINGVERIQLPPKE